MQTGVLGGGFLSCTLNGPYLHLRLQGAYVAHHGGLRSGPYHLCGSGRYRKSQGLLGCEPVQPGIDEGRRHGVPGPGGVKRGHSRGRGKKYRFPGGQQRPLRPQGNHHLSYPAVQQLPGRFRQGFSGCQAVAVQGLQLLPVGFYAVRLRCDPQKQWLPGGIQVNGGPLFPALSGEIPVPAGRQFLRQAAARHTVFDYAKIADYYAHASKEMQELMEDSALVIIDFGKAIEKGYIRLSDEIRNEYTREYGNEA